MPDVAIISAGVVTRSPTASGAIQDAASRMAARSLGAEARGDRRPRHPDEQSSASIPNIAIVENQSPQLIGYTASNQLTVRFRDIGATGKILDALVREGANQINGPNLTIDQPEAALDEARAKAIAIGRARADLYARVARSARRPRRLGQREWRRLFTAAANANVMARAGPVPPTARSMPASKSSRSTLGMTFELQ